MSRPVVLVILDGVGVGNGGEDDAVATALTPTFDALNATAPRVQLAAHGRAVGLPSDADMGNSEVGHNAMGAGQVVDQGARRVNEDLGNGAAWATPTWRALIATRTLHLVGLLSDGNVHSHVDHLDALIAAAARDGVRRLRLHLLTDGRDVGPRTALTWLQPLERRLADHVAAGRDYRVASGGGRMAMTMDRYEADWPMVARGWNCHVHGVGRPFARLSDGVSASYTEGRDDQHHPAFVVVDDRGDPVGRIQDGDGVLLFNFRGDRAVEFCRAFEGGPEFTAFDRGRVPDVVFAGMMTYDGDLGLPRRTLVAPPVLRNTLPEQLIRAGKRSFAVSETQKFGHVTYFFQGNRSGLLDPALDTWQEVPSDNVPFDERPWMKAAEVADATIAALATGRYDHIRVNFANGDMVGHTGDLAATRLAVSSVDHALGRVLAAARRAGALTLVTADHGNADQMWQHGKGGEVLRDEVGVPLAMTSHTLAPVPCWLVDPERRRNFHATANGAGLAAIAPTVATLLGVPCHGDWVQGLVAP